jgi:hypothetical protein
MTLTERPNAPILVRNTQPGPTVFTTADMKTAIDFEAGETKYVPRKVVEESIEFYEALAKGIFEIVQADDQMLAMLAQRGQAWRQAQANAVGVATSAIDKSANQPIWTGNISEKGQVHNPLGGMPVVIENNQQSPLRDAPAAPQAPGVPPGVAPQGPPPIDVMADPAYQHQQAMQGPPPIDGSAHVDEPPAVTPTQQFTIP